MYYKDKNDSLVRIDTIKTTSNPVNFGTEQILEAGTYYVAVRESGENSSSYYYYDTYAYSDYDLSMIDYKIMVEATPIVLVKNITITSSSKKLYTGEKLTVKAKVTPSNAENKNVTWT